MSLSRVRLGISVAIFVFAYISLNFVPRTFGRVVAELSCDLANAALVDQKIGNDLAMHFVPAVSQASTTNITEDAAWTAAVLAMRTSTGARAVFGVNLRKSYWVPSVVFAALALATLPWLRARSMLTLSAGYAILLVPMTLTAAVHVIAGLYEQYIIDLGITAQAAVRFIHAVLDPPGMVYALPVVLWGGSIACTSGAAESERKHADSMNDVSAPRSGRSQLE